MEMVSMRDVMNVPISCSELMQEDIYGKDSQQLN